MIHVLMTFLSTMIIHTIFMTMISMTTINNFTSARKVSFHTFSVRKIFIDKIDNSIFIILQIVQMAIKS